VPARAKPTLMDETPLLLFVCSGNICRSPMAEAIAADAARRTGVRIRVESTGTTALVGYPAEATALEALAELGLALPGHVAKQTEHRHVLDAALIVGATRSHRAILRRLHPERAAVIVSFDELTGLGDIPDPYGGSLAEYRTVRDMLVAGMPHVLAALKATTAAKAKP
jgi:protein-tyrosine-phosphatase